MQGLIKCVTYRDQTKHELHIGNKSRMQIHRNQIKNVYVRVNDQHIIIGTKSIMFM